MKIKISESQSKFRKELSQISKNKFWFNQILHSISIPNKIWIHFFSIFFLFFIHSFLFYFSLAKQIVLNYISIYLIFLFFDSILIFILPKLKISFGNFSEQILVIQLPRFLVSIFNVVIENYTELGFYLFLLFQLIGTIFYIQGMVFEPSKISITKIDYQSNKLKTKFNFIHLSDIHIERLGIREEKIIQYIKDNPPDFIFLTGDYLNLSNINDKQSFKDLKYFLGSLESKYGIYASMGSPPVDNRNQLQNILESAGVYVLRDQYFSFEFPSGEKINLIGVDCDHRQKIDSKVAEKLIQEMDLSYLRILLFHSPEIIPEIKNYPIDIYLCGHTHGGQIRLPFYGAIFTSSVTGKKYEMGSYFENETYLYVTRGVGLEGKIAPRMRLFCRPELVYWNIG